MHATVQDKLGSREVFDPVIMVNIGEKSEISLNFLVSAFCLAVGLGVICGS